MPLEDLMVAIQSTPLGTMIRENLFLFPVIERVHVPSLNFVVGTIAQVDFRLLGGVGANPGRCLLRSCQRRLAA
jgi:hypothetical protein